MYLLVTISPPSPFSEELSLLSPHSDVDSSVLPDSEEESTSVWSKEWLRYWRKLSLWTVVKRFISGVKHGPSAYVRLRLAAGLFPELSSEAVLALLLRVSGPGLAGTSDSTTWRFFGGRPGPLRGWVGVVGWVVGDCLFFLPNKTVVLLFTPEGDVVITFSSTLSFLTVSFKFSSLESSSAKGMRKLLHAQRRSIHKIDILTTNFTSNIRPSWEVRLGLTSISQSSSWWPPSTSTSATWGGH